MGVLEVLGSVVGLVGKAAAQGAVAGVKIAAAGGTSIAKGAAAGAGMGVKALGEAAKEVSKGK